MMQNVKTSNHDMENCRIKNCKICWRGEPIMCKIRLFAQDFTHPLHHHFWAAASQYCQASFYSNYLRLPVMSVDHVVNHSLRQGFGSALI